MPCIKCVQIEKQNDEGDESSEKPDQRRTRDEQELTPPAVQQAKRTTGS